MEVEGGEEDVVVVRGVVCVDGDCGGTIAYKRKDAVQLVIRPISKCDWGVRRVRVSRHGRSCRVGVAVTYAADGDEGTPVFVLSHRPGRQLKM